MKNLAFILSIYILALNFTPCEDSSVIDGSVNAELSQLENTNHNHNAADFCSPFCHCQCCQVHTIDVAILSFEPLSITISSEVFFHINNLGKEIPSTLFQPPRV